jgi:hypothetical protein
MFRVRLGEVARKHHFDANVRFHRIPQRRRYAAYVRLATGPEQLGVEASVQIQPGSYTRRIRKIDFIHLAKDALNLSNVAGAAMERGKSSSVLLYDGSEPEDLVYFLWPQGLYGVTAPRTENEQTVSG